MRHHRAFNVIVIFYLTAFPFAFAQTTSSRHSSKKSAHLQVSNSEIRNVRFRRLDHNVIQLAYDLFVNGDIFGQAIPHQQYATSIWIKDAGDWRLAYHQTTPAHHR